VRVSFTQVVEDSRCPASVACVWQGNAAIRLDIRTAGGTAFPSEVAAAGYTFTLIDLDPKPQTSAHLPAEQYRRHRE